jgi:hypothetical protein
MKLEGKMADDFIADVREGLSDDALKKKYEVSSRELVMLKAQAREKLVKLRSDLSKNQRMISGREFLKDVRAGLDDETIMQKYGLNQRQLQRLLRDLINAGAASILELSGRLMVTESQISELLEEVEKAKKADD